VGFYGQAASKRKVRVDPMQVTSERSEVSLCVAGAGRIGEVRLLNEISSGAPIETYVANVTGGEYSQAFVWRVFIVVLTPAKDSR
jgi:hypothetical protein